MKWIKLGRIFVANGEHPWMQTHAYMPTLDLRDDDLIRIYLAFLDKGKVGRVGYIEVEKDDPLKVRNISERPVLDIGSKGSFDDNGVTPMSIVNYRNRKYLYYIGWQLGKEVRYYLFSGLAISDDNGNTFNRYSNAPILARCDGESYVRTATTVVRENDIWKMWYMGGDEWVHIGDKELPKYNMRYMESADGCDWSTKSKICMHTRNGEHGFGRPSVVKENGIYKMWYSIRTVSKGYRMGYAESEDGIHWKRKDDEVGIDVSESSWDSTMIAFPEIIDVNGKRYMFYNGNNYGETGVGVALLEQ